LIKTTDLEIHTWLLTLCSILLPHQKQNKQERDISPSKRRGAHKTTVARLLPSARLGH
jgi:putative ribosome biogenesis GTPase RsgA